MYFKGSDQRPIAERATLGSDQRPLAERATVGSDQRPLAERAAVKKDNARLQGSKDDDCKEAWQHTTQARQRPQSDHRPLCLFVILYRAITDRFVYVSVESAAITYRFFDKWN